MLAIADVQPDGIEEVERALWVYRPGPPDWSPRPACNSGLAMAAVPPRAAPTSACAQNVQAMDPDLNDYVDAPVPAAT
eukprot:12047410-Alexandrium_andersonii.AAC.1